jgi:hypothetical protein
MSIEAVATIEGAFPDHRNPPAVCSQLGEGGLVILHIAFDLLLPETGVCLWPLEEVTVVAMKEAAMNKHDCLVLGER